MNRKHFLSAILILVSASSAFAQTSVKIKPKDLQPLGGNWKGSLTYLDYSSGKPYSMPADIEITQGKNSNVFILSNQYPDEPKANSIDSLIISKKGKMLNKYMVKSKQILTNGNTVIVAEYAGVDGNDNKPALIRVTYTFGKDIYTNIKEVQYVGENVWIKRHEYSYTRK